MPTARIEKKLLPAHRQPGTALGRHLHLGRHPVGPGESRGHDLAGPLPRQIGKAGRLGTHNGQRHAVDQRELLVQHAVAAPEAFQMSRRHVGDHRDAGLDHLAVPRHFARKAGAGLDDQRLGVGRRLEDRERHADQVVEVAPRRPDPIAGPQCRGQHFLGGGLAVGSGSRADRSRDGLPGGVGQLAERVAGIATWYVRAGTGAVPRRTTAPVAPASRAPARNHARRTVTLQRHEQRARANRAGIVDTPCRPRQRQGPRGQGARTTRSSISSLPPDS